MNKDVAPVFSVAVTSWPSRPPFRAGAFALHVEDASGVERSFWGWIDAEAAPSTHVWPGTSSVDLTPVALVSPGARSVVVTVQNFAQDDDLLADLRLSDGFDVQRGDHATESLERSAGLAYAQVVREILGAGAPAFGSRPTHAVTGLPTSHPAFGEADGLDLESWHCVESSGATVRALEHRDALLDADGEGARARRFVVLRSGALWGELVVPRQGDARWWPRSSSPLLDDPILSGDMPEVVARLRESIPAR